MEPPIPAGSKDLLEPQTLVGCRYRVRGFHRPHPLGELYRCVDETSHRVVLLHRLRPEFADPGVMERLFELREVGPLHPMSRAIVEICDHGWDLDERPYLISPWRDGAALAAHEGPWSASEVLRLTRLICRALVDAHDGQKIHGGIEPSSVIVTTGLADEGVALIGFGLAAALEAGAQRSRRLSLVAAPAHAAPELIRGDPLSPATDVYALGVLVWRLLCGAPPFRGPPSRVLEAQLGRALPRFEPRVEVPEGFEGVLRRMLAKDPAERFVNAGALLARLEPFAAFAPPEDANKAGGEDDATLVVARPSEARGEDDATVVVARPRVAGRAGETTRSS